MTLTFFVCFSVMAAKSWNRPSSLLSITLNIISDHLTNYPSCENYIKSLEFLPFAIKNRILKKITTSSALQRNPDYQKIIGALLNEFTHEIDMTSLSVDDNLFEIISKCVKLRRLYLAGDKETLIKPERFTKLFKNLASLTSLVLTNYHQITDKTLKELVVNCQDLQAIDLTGCTGITNEGLCQLSKLDCLTCIKLSNTKISDQGVIQLVQGPSSTRLKELRLDGCTNLTSACLTSVAAHCPNIEVLIFNNCSKSADEVSGLEDNAFKNLKQLTWTIPW